MKLRHLDLAPRAPGLERTLVLLHGYGADERDLLPLAHELDPRLRAVSLQAPLAMESGGRAWFNLEQTRGGFAFDPGEVAESARLLLAAVEEVTHTSPRPLLLGFSQGAGMALSLALLRPELISGVLALSSAPPRAAQPAPPERLRAFPAFVAHGLFDPLLTIETGRATRDLLQQLGLCVTWREYPMGHMVVPEEIEEARSW